MRKLLRLAFVLSIAVFAMAPCAFAEEGSLNENISWSLADGVLTISGTGAMPYGKVEAAESAAELIIEPGITSVGYMNFRGCTNLETVRLPEGLTDIGYSSFSGCKGLTDAVIPSSVTNIDEYAFSGCSSLENISIGENVERVGEKAFSGTAAYNNSENWENGVFYAGRYAVASDADELSENCVLRSDTLAVADFAFQHKNISSVDFGNSLKHIGVGSFGYTGLVSVSLPESVVTLRYSSFACCQSLETFNIGKNVSDIGMYILDSCYSLREINVSPENENYLSENGVLFNKDKTRLLKFPSASELTDFEVPRSVDSIWEYTFEKCPNLETLTIHAETEVGSEALSGLKNTLVRCCAGSEAERYCTMYGYNCELLVPQLEIVSAAENDGLTVEFAADEVDSSNEIIAVARRNGEVVDFAVADGNRISFSTEEIDSVSLLCWRGLGSLQPLCPAVNAKISELMEDKNYDL